MRSFLLVLSFANVCNFVTFPAFMFELSTAKLILKLLELEERCLLFSLLLSLDIIQGPPLVACSNLLVIIIIIMFNLPIDAAFNFSVINQYLLLHLSDLMCLLYHLSLAYS